MKARQVLDDATVKKLDRLGLEVVPKGTFRQARLLAEAASSQHHVTNTDSTGSQCYATFNERTKDGAGNARA